MTTYPRTKRVEADLLAVKNPFTIDCFIKDGVLEPGFSWSNTYTAVPEDLFTVSSCPGANAIVGCLKLGSVYSFSVTNALSYNHILRNETRPNTHCYFETTEDFQCKYVMCIYPYYVQFKNGFYKMGDLPKRLLSCAVRSGRLFAVEYLYENLLIWSGADDTNNWTEGGTNDAGKISMKPFGGKIKAVFSLKESLVLLRENCITTVAADGNPESFRILEDILAPFYYSDSAKVVADTLMYLSNDMQLVRFEKGKVRIVDCLITDDLTSYSNSGAISNKYYFVSGKSDKLGRVVTYIYNVLDETCQIVDVPAKFHIEDRVSALALTEQYFYRIRMDTKINADCGPIDFGTKKLKVLTELIMECDPGVSVEISDGRNSRYFSGSGRRIRVGMHGRSFGIHFTGRGKVYSAKLYAEVRI